MNIKVLTHSVMLILAALTASTQHLRAEIAPQFTLPTTGKSVSLSDYQGKVVYLDFWASWCAPCRKSFPWMNELQSRYGKQGLVVLAVNVDKDQQDLQAFLQKYPARFTVAFDPAGKTAEQYGLKGMPSSYLIDRNGNIVMQHIGFRENESHVIESKLKSLL